MSLWDITDPTKSHDRNDFLAEFRENDNAVVSTVAFSPDGRKFATGSFNQIVRLWDTANPVKPRRHTDFLHGHIELHGHTEAVRSVAFSPDGRVLATAGDDTVRLWDVTEADRPQSLGDPLPAHTPAVESVAFAPDGQTLATAGDDRTTALWDITDPTRPWRLGDSLVSQDGTISAVAFASDGSTLATASKDQTVQLWDISSLEAVRANPLERACLLSGGELNPEGWARAVPGLPYVKACAN